MQMEDNFPYNKGVKTGALVEASYGKGRWVYVGLGLWRQLPAGHRRRVSAAREPDLARPTRQDRQPRSQVILMEVALTPLEFARRTRALYGDREAVVDGALRLTYAQFFDRVRPMVGGAAARSASRPATAWPTSRRTRTRSSSRSTPCRRSAPSWCRSTTG